MKFHKGKNVSFFIRLKETKQHNTGQIGYPQSHSLVMNEFVSVLQAVTVEILQQTNQVRSYVVEIRKEY